MRILKLIFILWLCLSSVFVYADTNDGKPRDDPFGDIGAAPSFGGDAKYYDYFVPYNSTLKEIGGYAVSATYSSGSSYAGRDWIPDEKQLAKPPYQLNVQGAKSSPWIGCTVQVDSNTNFQYIEKEGCKFYIASLGKGLFNYSGVGKDGFYYWADLSITGVIYDVILADGTIIHFTTGDGIGINHSNNDANYEVKTDRDGVYFKFAKLNYKAYKNTVHAATPSQLLECFCKGSDPLSKFKTYYNISDTNPIVAIRIWNKSIKDGGFEVNSGFEGLSTKGDAIGTSSSSSEDSTSLQFQKGFYKETDFYVDSSLKDEILYMPSADDMTVNEQKQMGGWSENILNNNTTLSSIIRKSIAFIGIVITIYCILIYCCYWLDRMNNFIEVSTLSFLTVGQLEISPDDRESTFNPTTQGKKLVTHKDILKITVMGILIGVLIMSGLIYRIIGTVWFLVKNLIT